MIYVSDFKLISFKQFDVLKGTYRVFGLRSAICLISPLMNLLLNWKYRKHKLKYETIMWLPEDK